MLYETSHTRKQSISREGMILFAKLSLFVILFVGALTYAFHLTIRKGVVAKLKSQDQQLVDDQVAVFREGVRRLGADVMLAANVIRHNVVDRKLQLSELTDDLANILLGDSKNFKIRVIASDGMELINIFHERGELRVIANDSLQDKSGRPYFRESIRLEPGQIYVSHLDLNKEYGEVMRPFTPIIRAATPLYLGKEESSKVVVIISYLARELLNNTKDIATARGFHVLLADAAGYWLKGLREEDNWGSIFEDRRNRTIATTFPEFGELLPSSKSGQSYTQEGLFSFGTVTLEDITLGDNRFERLVHTETLNAELHKTVTPWEIRVIAYLPKHVINEAIIDASKGSIVAAIIILALLLVGCWRYVRQEELRKSSYKELQQKETFIHTMVATAGESIIIIDGEGIIQLFNDAATRMFGYDKDATLGRNITMLMPEQYIQKHIHGLRCAMHGESQLGVRVSTFTCEVQGKRADGSIFDMELTVNPFLWNERRMFMGMVRDITERKKAEHRVKTLALYAEHNPSPVFRVDRSRRIMDCNKAAETAFELRRRKHERLSNVIPELDEESIELCMEHGRAVSRQIQRGGRSYIVLVKGVPEYGICQVYAVEITEQKNAEISAADFGSILNDSLNEVYIINQQSGLFLFVNKAARKNLGYTEKEITALGPADIALDETFSLHETLADLISGQREWMVARSQHKRKDGSAYPVEIHVENSRFENRDVFVSFAMDITERVASEKREAQIKQEADEKAKERQRVIDAIFERINRTTGQAFFHELTKQFATRLGVEVALVGEFECDTKDVVRVHSLYADGKVSGGLRYQVAGTPSEVIRDTGKCVQYTGAQERFSADKVLVERNVDSFSGVRLTSSDGEVMGLFSIMCSGQFNDPEFQEYALRVFSSRAAAELERLRVERRMKRMYQAVASTSDIVVITDSAGRIEYVNPAFERVTGYREEEVIGKNPRILKSGKQDRSVYERMWGALSKSGSWRGTFVNRKKDGSFYTAEISISAIRDESGAVINYIAVERDITERIESEQRLRQAQKMEAIGALAGGIAHDFNNMLMGISGFTQMVADELPEDSPLAEDLQEALNASARAKDLVQQILTFSRQRESERKPMMLHLIVKEALKLLKATLPDNIVIRQDIPANCGSIMGDPTQAHQIIMNLCTNAYHAMGEDGGTLSVSLSCVTVTDADMAKQLEIEPGEYITLSIADTGCGMDEQTRARIFEPFFTTKQVGEGTGLGLATVYGIVKEYQGAITVESVVGEGTVFTVYLPRVQDECESTATAVDDDYRGDERVLVVEDDQQTLKVTTKMLQKLGYRVAAMRDPLDALEAIQNASEEFDVLITDKTMPKLSGIELARRIHEISQDIPILLLTGYAESITPEVASELGFASLMIKPVDSKALGREIQKALRSKRSASSSLQV